MPGGTSLMLKFYCPTFCDKKEMFSGYINKKCDTPPFVMDTSFHAIITLLNVI